MDPIPFFYMETERLTTRSLVPFRSFPCSLEGAKTRRYVPFYVIAGSLKKGYLLKIPLTSRSLYRYVRSITGGQS